MLCFLFLACLSGSLFRITLKSLSVSTSPLLLGGTLSLLRLPHMLLPLTVNEISQSINIDSYIPSYDCLINKNVHVAFDGSRYYVIRMSDTFECDDDDNQNNDVGLPSSNQSISVLTRLWQPDRPCHTTPVFVIRANLRFRTKWFRRASGAFGVLCWSIPKSWRNMVAW